MSRPTSMVGTLAVLDALKAERDKAIRQRDDARAERDDAHLAALKHAEASVAALKDLKAYTKDKADLADIVEDLEAQLDQANCRIQELEGEAGWGA